MRKRGTIEGLELRSLLTATIVEYGQIAYIFAEAAPRVDRYDLSGEAWLPPLLLDGVTGGTNAAAVIDEGIFAGFGNAVYHFDRDGGEGEKVVDLPYLAAAIFADDGYVFVQSSLQFYSVDAASRELIDSKYFSSLSSFMTTITPETNWLFGHTLGAGSGNIESVQYGDDGRFVGYRNSPYQGDLPLARIAWAFPGGDQVVDGAGTVYKASSLDYVHSFGSRIDAIDFVDTETPVIAWGQSLTKFDARLFPESTVTLGYSPSRLFASEDRIIALTADGAQPSGFRADEVPWSAFGPILPGPAIDPVDLAYTPDDWRVAADGTLLLLDKAHQSIFRWDPVAQRHVGSIRLLDTPYQFAYSPELNVALLGYVSGRVTLLDLNSANPVESPLATLPGAVLEIESLGGNFFFTADGSFGLTHSVLTMDGVKVDSERRAYGDEFTWSAAMQRLFFFRATSVDLMSEEINADGAAYPELPPGGIGQLHYSSLSSQFSYRPPIRIADDGSFLVLASGQVVDAGTLTQHSSSLANWIEDGAWIGDELFTTRRQAERTQLQRWTRDSFINDKAVFVVGEPIGIAAVSDDRLVAINRSENGTPLFRVFTKEFEEIPAPYAIEVAESHGRTAVHENGIQDSATIYLRSQPASDVVVRALAHPDAMLALSAESFVFTPDNWNVPQVLTLATPDQASADGWRSGQVRFEIADAQSDATYREALPAFLTVDVGDDETTPEALTEYAGVVYVLSQMNARIDRYSLENETWLGSLDIGEAGAGASAFHIDADGIFVAIGATVYRYDLAGGDPQRIFTLSDTIRALHADEGLLIAVNGNGKQVAFVDKASRELRNAYDNVFEAVGGSSIAPSLNRIFGRRSTTSPTDIVYISYDSAGSITDMVDSPYHGDQPSANRTWVFPNEKMVLDDSGTVYSTYSLRKLGSVAGGIDDVEFYTRDYAILRLGRSLQAFFIDLQFVGSVELPDTPAEMFANSSHLVAFTENSTMGYGYQVALVALSDLGVLPRGRVFDPVDLSFRTDQVEQASDGTLLLLSSAQRTLFRWNPAAQQFMDAIPLLARPSSFAYAANANVVYIAYSQGLIYKLDLSAPDAQEMPFASLAQPIAGLAMAGDYLYVASGDGATGQNLVLRPDGVIADVSQRDTETAGFVWSDANQKMYFLRQSQGANRLNWEEVNANGEAYPGVPPGAIRNRFTSGADFLMMAPIRIRPDGQVGLLGSQQVFDAQNLTFVDFLPNAVLDATWLDDDLYAVRNVGELTEVQRFVGDENELVGSLQLPGRAVAIRSVGDDRIVVVVRQPNSPPGFYILDANLSTVKRLVGDSNFDGTVDLQDLNNVRNRFGEAGHGDADGDGDIDLEDLNAVRNRFGATTESLAASPPSMVVRASTSHNSSSDPFALKRRDYADAHFTKAVDQIHDAEIVAWQWWREATGKSSADGSFTSHRKSRRSLTI